MEDETVAVVLARVIVTNPMIGLIHMQVCAVKDATDEEMLEVANKENPAGTSNGWGIVLRGSAEHENQRPVQCDSHPDRLHFILVC